jgi:REP-associated tyrosine transposase
VRNAIVYVLQNHRHHERSRFIVDENSSGLWFAGWSEPLPPPATAPPVAEPVTWLARIAWRRYGPIRFEEAPSDAPR